MLKCQMASCPRLNCASSLVLLTIWVELSSGLAATTWTAFFNNLTVDVSAYLIFAVDVGFSMGVFFYTFMEIRSRWKPNQNTTTTIIWVFVGCTIVTFGLFYTLAYYNVRVVGHKNGIKVIKLSFGIFFAAVAVFVILNTFSLFRPNHISE